MKSKTNTERLDEAAVHAMQAILTGLYTNPGMLSEFDKMATLNKQSLALEVAERSYLMAVAMQKKREKMISDVD